VKNSVCTSLVILSTAFFLKTFTQPIPLPEHPRPDFERPVWQNLNGAWDFEFDSLDVGLAKKWQLGSVAFSWKINVPFSWSSPLSGVQSPVGVKNSPASEENYKSDFGWYKKTIRIPKSWSSRRVFITIGASDWETTAWLDGILLGKHQGGYTPFSFELSGNVTYDSPQTLVIRVDDKRRDFTLYGKQGYGNARGIWQTVYLEGRGKTYLESVHFTPDIDKSTVAVQVKLSSGADTEAPVTFRIKTSTSEILSKNEVAQHDDHATFEIPIPDARLWTLDDPFLYETEIALGDDVVKTYFGMRKISVINLPNTNYPYIALNNQPVYLQLTLDQSYHPEGFYTFPTDDFMKNEIKLCKDIGLNGIRTHIKIDVPRKLYWADKLGLLVMSDLPNSWGEPDEKMQAESEFTLREMIKRDYNHPSIFSWITFNETWGLTTKVIVDNKPAYNYLPGTQQWVASMYHLAKSLDPSRLVEDNSICCGRGHTETDINSWHEYLPGWEWENHLSNIDKNTFDGSPFHFEKGFKQGSQPNINSECGNVWGYDGSTGDVDWSWDYHRMINTFRKYPKVAGWLYTEHHDVINEWNGYWRFDRSKKFTGLGEIVPGMKLNDLHAPVYLSTGNEICETVRGGEKVSVPLYLSSMTGEDFGTELELLYQLNLTNAIGETSLVAQGVKRIGYQPYLQKELESLVLDLPDLPGLALLTLQLQDKKGTVLHHNFMHFEVIAEAKLPKTEVLSIEPANFSDSKWSAKQWNVLEGLKVCGAGSGYFEYKIKLNNTLDLNKIKEAYFLVEISAKELFVKDRDQKEKTSGNFMLGAKASPSGNPNSYPMTDEKLFPSVVTICVDGEFSMTTTLPDDPADHRGVLSWHHQLKDKKLREAGSYGYLTKIPVTKKQLKSAIEKGELVVRLKTVGEGGIAVYGKSFGRYPLDPSLVVKLK
jgi:hypothetical protein